MKLLFEFDREKKKIVFFGNGFEISSNVETYEDIADFAKSVIENDIAIPTMTHKSTKDEKQGSPQIEAIWETCTEVKNNTVCGDGAKIQHKRCSNCKQPMGLVEECFCGKCGAKIKAAMVEQRGDSI